MRNDGDVEALHIPAETLLSEMVVAGNQIRFLVESYKKSNGHIVDVAMLVVRVNVQLQVLRQMCVLLLDGQGYKTVPIQELETDIPF